jgi:hypothetical protein
MRGAYLSYNGGAMPKLSKDSAPNVQDAGGLAIDRNGDLDGTSVSFVTIRQSHSLAPLLRGLPGDRCQCPHWGYLLAGKITVSYADHEEAYQAGPRDTSPQPRQARSSSSSAPRTSSPRPSRR